MRTWAAPRPRPSLTSPARWRACACCRSPPPPRAPWYTDPGKVFDNLYFVGTKIHSAWALTTSEGIILIDTVYDYNSEEAIVEGMKKLGLDPATGKYVVMSQ